MAESIARRFQRGFSQEPRPQTHHSAAIVFLALLTGDGESNGDAIQFAWPAYRDEPRTGIVVGGR